MPNEEQRPEYFVCEIIKPIKRRSIKTALNKNKSMNKVLSIHTRIDQCLYQFLRDGQCYNGKDPYSCNEFKNRTDGIDLERLLTELKAKLKDSIVLKYTKQAEGNRVAIGSSLSAFTHSLSNRNLIEGRIPYSKVARIKTIGSGGGRGNKDAPKSLCKKCGQWVRYPHDPDGLTVKCWLCAAEEVLSCENQKPETPEIKTGEANNGKRTSIPKRKKAGRRNTRK